MTIEDQDFRNAMSALMLGNTRSAYMIIENAFDTDKVPKTTLAIWRAENRQQHDAKKFAGPEERLLAYVNQIEFIFGPKPCDCAAA